jgi:DnaJ-class molecular chaperone
MTKLISNYKMCTDCKGTGHIETSSRSFVSCIICNGSGSTTHGSSSEAEQVLLFKIAWDYINGRQNGWYH